MSIRSPRNIAISSPQAAADEDNIAQSSMDDQAPQRTFVRRNPAVCAAVSFAAGIAIDRFLVLPWLFWLTCSAALAIAWVSCWCRRRNLPAAILLAVLGFCAGGARHHQVWSVESANDLSLFAGDDPKLVHITGTLVTQPRIHVRQKDRWRSAWPRPDYSQALVQCRTLQTSAGPIAVSGLAELWVTGHVLNRDAGDDVEIHGWLSRPTAPRNPGDPNGSEFLQGDGARCVVHTDHPDAVCRLSAEGNRSVGQWVSRWRAEIEYMFAKYLSPRTVPVASSLILGDRGGLTREVRDAFAESGMMHILAISGQNVGILAALFWFVCRMFRFSERTSAAVIVAVSICYALLTLGEPPILRATVMVLLAALGRPWHRYASLLNLLAIAALLLLLWSPADLFDVGAQLSFLAVLAMGWFASSRFSRRFMSSTAFAGSSQTWAVTHAASTLKQAILLGYGVTVAIWIFTLPLVAARFHLVSPIGLVVNVLLAPAVVAVLWMGYAFAACGLLLPPTAAILGPVFDCGLRGFLRLIELAANSPLAWFYVPAIPEWWLATYYAILVLVVGWQRGERVARKALAALLLWTIFGLSVGLLPSDNRNLRLTFLSVGHGCSVLVEAPNGRTLLYDGGAIHDADFAQHAVENALWQAQRRGLDAVVISHADVDHFNGVPGLLQSIPVGSLIVSKSFLDFRQGLVQRLCDAAADRGIPIRLVQRGDRVCLDDNVHIEVLHPTTGPGSVNDNANSLVLAIEFAGRRVILTGDLADDGLRSLLEAPPRKFDVLLSPHHGSLASNPPELANWARPELVIVSNSRTSTLPVLRQRYAAQVMSTHESGAILVEIGTDGAFSTTTQISREIPAAE